MLMTIKPIDLKGMFFLLLRAEAGGWASGLRAIVAGVVGVLLKVEFMVACWLGAPKLRGYCWSRCLR